MADFKYSNKKDDFPVFSGAGKEEIRHLMQKLVQYLQNIFVILGIKNTNEIEIDTDSLFELLNRVEMRRIYFHVFHDGIEMGELNEGCLLCFWILKFKPFKHQKIHTRILNVKIALCLFLNMLTYVAYNRENKTVNKTSELVRQLSYAFQYRDLSKEALMMIGEAFIRNK